MTAVTATKASGNTWIDGVQGGTQWARSAGSTVLKVYLAGLSDDETVAITDPEGTYSITARGFGAEELRALQGAFDNVSAVCNLRFQLVSTRNAADVVVASTDDADAGGALGWAYLPGGATNPGTGRDQSVLVPNREAYDYFDPGQQAGVLIPGSFSYVTYIHELGHILGLEHPHDVTDDEPNFPGVGAEFDDYGNFAMNQGIHTTMSYNSGWPTSPLGELPPSFFGFEQTYMALDIAALQHMYGANTGTRTGNDVYALPAGNAVGTGYSCLWDAGGTDLVLGASSRANTIDLRAATLGDSVDGGGHVSFAQGVRGGLTIARGVVIENATGGSEADWIRGNGAANVLHGLGGNDSLIGSGGADILFGEAGSDRLDGGAGDDRLRGHAGADQLYGGGGADRLRGDGGADVFTGGNGADLFLFISRKDAGIEAAADVIRDFQRGLDRIDLSAIDARSDLAGDQAFRLDTGGGFKQGEFQQELGRSSVTLLLNLDGDSAPEFAIKVLGGRALLHLSDLVL